MLLDNVKQRLLESKHAIRCNELGLLLESLGFIVRDGKKGGHKLYIHPELDGFHSGSYNCGHGKNLEIKPAYIGQILRVLNTYDAELTEFLRGSDNDEI